ncbi:MAG TPA: hypothetical protein VJ385_04780 [Fibrobacteria bacterium]|nr:hypothetical protein [Fibrobacteria bacterium]
MIFKKIVAVGIGTKTNQVHGSRNRQGKFLQARVARRGIEDGFRRFPKRTGQGVGFEIQGSIWFIVGGEKGPTVEAGTGGDVVLIISIGNIGVFGLKGTAGIGSGIPHEQPSGFIIQSESEGVAMAHGVDLGPGGIGAGREQIPRRNGVGGADTRGPRFRIRKGDGGHPQYFPAQVIGISGGARGVKGTILALQAVESRSPGPIHRIDLDGISVVARGKEKMAGLIESERAARMVESVIGYFQEDLFRVLIHGAGAKGEAGKAAAKFGLPKGVREIKEIDPTVSGKIRIEGQSAQAVAIPEENVGHDIEGQNLADGSPRNMPLQLPVFLREKDRTVRSHGKLHGISGIGNQNRFSEFRRGRRPGFALGEPAPTESAHDQCGPHEPNGMPSVFAHFG